MKQSITYRRCLIALRKEPQKALGTPVRPTATINANKYRITDFLASLAQHNQGKQANANHRIFTRLRNAAAIDYQIIHYEIGTAST